MLRLPRFQYFSPRSDKEAACILRDFGPEGRALAGGTDLIPKMKRRQLLPKALVGLERVGTLSEVRCGRGELAIGAMTRLAELSRHPRPARLAALRQAAESIASPTLRSMATVGGNLALDTRCAFYDRGGSWRASLGGCLKLGGDGCHAASGSKVCLSVFSADLPPALIALGARARILGADGERTVPLEEIYRPEGQRPLALEPGDLVTQVLLEPDGLESSYLKLRRRSAVDFQDLGVAVAVRRDASATVCSARVVLSGLGPAPIVAAQAAGALEGTRLDPEAVEEASAAALAAAKPVANTDFSAAYRRKMVPVFLRRALESLA